MSALLNSSPASTTAAADAHNLPATAARHPDLASLVSDSEIDAVAVSVKVPDHATYIRAALQAEKDVFCEWPLARTLPEAESLTALAREKGVRTMVGLQARQSPAVRKARELVSSNALGDILGTTMLGAGMIFGPTAPETYRYLCDIENGANLLTIPCMHAVDALCFVLGEWDSVSATLANKRPTLQLIDDNGKEVEGEGVPKSSHDYIALTGTLADSGGVASVVYEGGTSRVGKDFYWEIKGTEGTLVLEGPSGHVQMAEPQVTWVKSDGTKFESEAMGLPKPEECGPAWNVSEAWSAWAGEGEGTVTRFEDALVRHRMVDAVYRSAESGRRETYL